MQKNNSQGKVQSSIFAKQSSPRLCRPGTSDFAKASTNKSADKQKEKVFVKNQDEKILVVKKNILFSYQTFNGLKKVLFNDYQKLINKHKKFLWRSKMEIDFSYKQIIPYLVFSYEDQFFMMKRKNTSSETRLKNKYSLGIGGHIREEDMKKSSIIDWAKREFEEEVKYNASYKVIPVGLLNDERNDVGKVHVGFVFLLKGNSAKIAIRDEHIEGDLMSMDECKLLYNQMESWSQIVFDFLKEEQEQKK